MIRIAYLHGFNSGPASIKGQQMAQAIEALPKPERPEYFVPRLSHAPAQAMLAVSRWAEGGDREALAFVGSSLGGFYATHLAEKYSGKAVLINPVIDPARLLAPYLGRPLDRRGVRTHRATSHRARGTEGWMHRPSGAAPSARASRRRTARLPAGDCGLCRSMAVHPGRRRPRIPGIRRADAAGAALCRR